MSKRETRDWASYYEATRGRPPRPTLLRALASFQDPGFAIDLGCGGGRDTLELLRQGWQVLAIDAEPEAARFLERLDEITPAMRARLTLVTDRFETFQPPACDLANSSFALPLCPPEAFRGIWARLTAAIRPGGRFAGQLFGPHDEFASRPGVTIHDRPALDTLFADYAIEHLEEEESDAVTPRGTPKHWHIFHVVAQRL